MKINLLDVASFDGGHPIAQYDHLLAEAPVYWHEEAGGRGFWAVTRVSRCLRYWAQRGGFFLFAHHYDSRPSDRCERRECEQQDDAHDGSAGTYRLSQAD